MNESFCWESKKCDKPCPVKDSQTLFCWRMAQAEGLQHPDTCSACNFRRKWFSDAFSLEDFIKHNDRRGGQRGRKRVLVIDDEPNILYALEETVRAGGFDCLTAPDGEEGLFLAQQTKPDLIISDVIMPKINGFELCRSIKTDLRTKDIPVILVTVRSMMSDMQEGQNAGADAYLIKPFHAQELEEKIGVVFDGPGEK